MNKPDMGRKHVSDRELMLDLKGAAMSKQLGYVEGQFENTEPVLTKRDYSELGKYDFSTVQTRFSSGENDYNGFNNVKAQLGLEKYPSPKKDYPQSSEEKIEELKKLGEDGLAPKHSNELNTDRFRRDDGDLFQTYLDAVWLSGLTPRSTWYAPGEDNQAEIEAQLRDITSDNYWSGDPDLQEKSFEAPEEHLFPFYNLRRDDDGGRESLRNNRNEVLPNLQIGQTNGKLSRNDQENLMDLVKTSDTYIDLLDQAETQGFNRNDIEKMLEPNAEPKDGGSFGRWMSRDEFPKNSPMIQFDKDRRKEP